METVFIEASSDAGNWGKFVVGRFTEEEWQRRSAVKEPNPDVAELLADGLGFQGWIVEAAQAQVLAATGWSREHLLVLDLATGEGAIFRHGGLASADLTKHKIWCCPLFEPFLEWLYEQDVSDLATLPHRVDLSGVPLQMQGYRRPGRP